MVKAIKRKSSGEVDGIGQTTKTLSSKEINILWKQHQVMLRRKGILPTFKPVRFYTSEETSQLDRMYRDRNKQPTEEDYETLQ